MVHPLSCFYTSPVITFEPHCANENFLYGDYVWHHKTTVSNIYANAKRKSENRHENSPMLNMCIEISYCFERGVAYICAIKAWSLQFVHFKMKCNFILLNKACTKFHKYYNQYTKTLKTHFPLCKKEFMTPLQEYFVTEWFIMTVEQEDWWVTGTHKNSWHVSCTFSWLMHVNQHFLKKISMISLILSLTIFFSETKSLKCSSDGLHLCDPFSAARQATRPLLFVRCRKFYAFTPHLH